MKFHYYPETDSLYIELLEDKSSIDSKEVAPNIVLDFDEDGNLIGIDIDNASRGCKIICVNSLNSRNGYISKKVRSKSGNIRIKFHLFFIFNRI